ncbi:response regulator [Evansella sp. AB-rgal1]|uniref:response regulator n=1 Tax=Evansella sp. AB-rgal1 TaxID=3242696 RepID=UPI00359EC3C8
MFKVLLVDDEMFARQGLRSLIEWEKCGFEVISEAANGEDAFEIIESLHPDVVITDIRMPVVDGLELIQNVNQTLEVKPKFVIISGYNDFSYAQKAVRYGVFDFVLKPVDEEELETTLKKLAEELEKQVVIKASRQKQISESNFVQLLEGGLTEKDVADWAKSLHIDKSDHFYYVIIEINNLSPNERISIEDDVIKDAMTRLGNESNQLALYIHHDNAVGLLLSSDQIRKYNGEIETLLNKLNREIAQSVNKPITIFVGDRVDNLLLLKSSFDTASNIRNYKYIIRDKKVILYEQVKDLEVTYNELDNKIYLSLLEKVEENKVNEIEEEIDHIFHEFQLKNFSPSAIKTSINRCVFRIIQIINSMDGDEKKITSLVPMTNWEKHNLTYHDLKRLFSNFVLEGSVVIQELRKENMKGDIHKVKTYVDNNFHMNISLKSIATKFYMNPVYMGQLFKRTFDIYFKEYLLNLRVDEAKKLLRQTDMRVYEVAEKVGFGSTDYFVTQFEKINKMTPTEYRNKLLKK